MALQPFVWGQGGQKLSPQEAARQREMAKALMGQNSSVAQNPWEGIAQVARATTGTVLGARADAAETEGRAELAQLLAGVGPDTDMETLMGIYGNGWANPQEQSIAELLINQDMKQSDPAYQLDMQLKQAQLDAARTPEAPKPIEIGGILVDPVTYEPLFDSRQPVAAPRPMSAEDRASWGIPSTDTTPYYLDENGQPKAIGGGGVNVTVGGEGGAPGLGKLSTDFGYVVNPETLQPVVDPVTGLPKAAPIPGSPAAIAAAQAAERDLANNVQAANSADIVLTDIDTALEQVSGWTAGAGSLLSNIPGTGAVDLASSLDTIKANIGFDRLQQMREASPTGGALGGIAVEELRMLQSVMGSLNTAQTPEQLKANLARLKEVYEPIAKKAKAYPNAGEFGFTGGVTPSQPQPSAPPIPQVGEVVEGYVFKGGDPSVRESWEQVQ